MFGEVNPTNAPSGWKCTHHVKSGKDCEQCFVEILLAQILECFGRMEHPMEAGLTLGAAVEQFNLFASDKFISFDNCNV